MPTTKRTALVAGACKLKNDRANRGVTKPTVYTANAWRTPTSWSVWGKKSLPKTKPVTTLSN
jgi:hypothetical protein